MKTLVSFLVVLLLVGCLPQNQNEPGYDPWSSFDASVSYPKLKSYALELRPELAEMDELELAMELRAWVYNVTSVLLISDDQIIHDPYLNFKEIIESPQTYGHLCGGIGKTYFDLLYAFGYKVRWVNLFTARYPEINTDTHVAVEVEVGGKYIASDPTFNIVLINSANEMMNYQEARDYYYSGGSITYSTNGLGTTERLDNYYLPYVDFLHSWRTSTFGLY